MSVLFFYFFQFFLFYLFYWFLMVILFLLNINALNIHATHINELWLIEEVNKFEKVNLTKIKQLSNNSLHKCYESNNNLLMHLFTNFFVNLTMDWLTFLVMNVLTNLVMYLLMNEWNESETKKNFKKYT